MQRSSSEPPQRTRTISQLSPVVISVQLATIGRSRIAATWAITSLPRSVPQAITADAATADTSWATLSPHASGP